MAGTTTLLTYDEFRQLGFEQDFEFWYGKAVPRSMPTWIHGLLQKIVMALLDKAGYISASEVEIRIDMNARPKPDVIATKQRATGQYPTQAPDVIVEVISEDDALTLVRNKCRKYESWGCQLIYLVDPSDRSVSQWSRESLIRVDKMVGSIPVSEIWIALDQQSSEEAR